MDSFISFHFRSDNRIKRSVLFEFNSVKRVFASYILAHMFLIIQRIVFIFSTFLDGIFFERI